MIALIHSPFQAYSLCCYLKQAVPKSPVIVIVRSYEQKKQLSSFEAIKAILMGLDVEYFLMTDRNRLFKIFLAFWLINRNKNVLVGDLTNKLNQLILFFSFKRKDITLLEDGTSLHVDKDEIARNIKKFNIKKIYSISNLSSDVYPNTQLIQGQLIQIKNPMTEFEPGTLMSKLILLGSPLVDFGTMIEKDYIDLINKVTRSESKPKRNLVYIRHRREKAGMLKAVDWAGHNVEIVNFPLGVDLTLLSNTSKLKLAKSDLIMFPSTAVLILAEAGILNKFKSVKLINLSDARFVDHAERTLAINELCLRRCAKIGEINVFH